MTLCHILLMQRGWVPIGLIGRVFITSWGDWGSVLGWVIPKTQNMVLDTSLLNTQHYKVRIKSKLEQSRERRSALPYTLVWELLKRDLWVALVQSPTLYIYIYIYTHTHTYTQINTHLHMCVNKFTHTYIYIYI